MRGPYLEVTLRHGRPLAAYLYLPREPGEKSVRTAKTDLGMLIDFGSHGKPIGIELTAPARITPQALNLSLTDLGLLELSAAELEPLRAA